MTPENEQEETVKSKLDSGLMGTARLNPDDYRARSNATRLESFKFALAGLLYMFRHEESVRAMTAVTFIAFMIGFWLRISALEWALVLLGIGIVWAAEFLNSAVEAVVDLATQEIHPMAKIAKDVASAAVLVGTLIMLGVLVLVLGPPLLERLG